MSTVATVPVMIVLVLIILLPFIVGFFVYRDARQRNMNAILWALVAALAPAFIGLIVYLLVRGNYMNLQMPTVQHPSHGNLCGVSQVRRQTTPLLPKL